jgi:hypothetical protein
MLDQPNVLPRYTRTEMVMAKPRSLSRMYEASRFSYSGLRGSKWFTPPPQPFFLPLPRPSRCLSW